MLRLQSTPCVPSSTTSSCHSHNYDSASSVIRIHSVRFPVTRFWWSKRARGRYVFENKWRFLCRSSQGNSSAGCHGDSSQEWNNDDRFLQATLLVTGIHILFLSCCVLSWLHSAPFSDLGIDWWFGILVDFWCLLWELISIADAQISS